MRFEYIAVQTYVFRPIFDDLLSLKRKNQRVLPVFTKRIACIRVGYRNLNFHMSSTNFQKPGYTPIADYGVIGNLKTCALISSRGSIDFLPFPYLDSSTIFTALLDKNKGGFFDITPLNDEVNYKQLYLPQTAILLSRFLTNEGMAELTDFMPVESENGHTTIIRKLVSIRGKMKFAMNCCPQFDYAQITPSLEEHENGSYCFHTEGMKVYLHTDVELKPSENGISCTFELDEGDEAAFVLHSDPLKTSTDLHTYIQHEFTKCRDYWHKWSSRSGYKGRWREMVNRSAMVLKLLSSNKYGSVAAAATFGLPETPGGERNWDYRFTWIRDSAFTMYAFLRLGYVTEAREFISWVKHRFEEDDLQLMYRLDGSPELKEYELNHLEGYGGARPVRVGNDASDQLQMDIYGELIDTIYLYNKFGGGITYDFWQLLTKQVNYVCANWQKPDHGIWEVRSEKREFLYSRVMCWVALDRAIRITDKSSFPGPVQQWRETRDEIFRDVYENFWSEEKQSFVQYKGGHVVDASALLMPLVRFIHPKDPRWVSTLKTIERELVTDSLVYRYIVEDKETDGLEGTEGTFSICSFWYVECLVRGGEIDKAKLYFEKMLGYANHLGLFSEQIGLNGDQLGNFPQAFTHLALISSAYAINKALDQKADLT